MKTKKSSRVNLDNKRNSFFLLGLSLALGTVLMAFEYRTDSKEYLALQADWDYEEVEMLPITRPPEPPKPKLQCPVPVLDFEVVEDDIEVPELEFFETEFTEDAIPDVDLGEEIDDGALVEFWDLSTKPSFVGGEKAMFQFFKEQISYPEVPRNNEIEGRVFVSFVVNKKGEITKVKVERGVDPYLDQEAIRVIESMPNWNPGKQRGKPVNVSYVLPINFKLF